MSFSVAYEAQIQFDRLTKSEKAELAQLFANPQPPAARVQTPIEDRYVSRLGSKRVLWRRIGANQTPEILTVLDESYAA